VITCLIKQSLSGNTWKLKYYGFDYDRPIFLIREQHYSNILIIMHISTRMAVLCVQNVEE